MMMVRRRSMWLFCLAGLLLLFGLLVLIRYQQRSHAPLSVNMEESFLYKYLIREDQVVFLCRIAIENPSGQESSFSIYAWSPEDVKGGLLLLGSMTGYVSGSDVLHILKGEKSQYFEVEFIGKAGGAKTKQDRLLPSQIKIVEWTRE